jgi:hypothetical protein
MKRPRHGIRSTTQEAIMPRQPEDNVTIPAAINDTPIRMVQPPLSIRSMENDEMGAHPPRYGGTTHHLIEDNDSDPSVANIFAFGAFADKHSGVVYNNLTGSFSFMSLDGSVCIFVLYHYKSNCTLADPIKALDDKTIFEAYRKQYDKLTKKGFKVKLNVMDNQATKYIKQFLTKNDCQLQLVEPHNHRINATERAIQTFKDAFIAALATTDSDFPIQLWDRLTPQVMNTLNLLRALRINPTISAYEALNGRYDWNRYPLAPLGCKAVIYEDGDIRGSWASRGVDGWYLGPSIDHYQCDVYYVPETKAYRVSGLTKLFPQHCQLPNLTPHQHLRKSTDELAVEGTKAGTTTKGCRLLTLLQTHIGDILTPLPLFPPVSVEPIEEQRVRLEQQRVIDYSPIITIPRITDAPGIMASQNPMAKQNIRETPLVHK